MSDACRPIVFIIAPKSFRWMYVCQCQREDSCKRLFLELKLGLSQICPVGVPPLFCAFWRKIRTFKNKSRVHNLLQNEKWSIMNKEASNLNFCKLKTLDHLLWVKRSHYIFFHFIYQISITLRIEWMNIK